MLKAGGRLGAHPAETVAAIDRAVSPWAEGHHGVVAALSADDWVHFPGTVLVHSAAAASLLGSANRAATAATLGFIPEPASLEEFLFPGSEYELGATFHADQGLIRQCHW